MAPLLGILLPMACSAVLVGALALPMLRRRVPPNRLYGLRTPATLADPEVWYEANARSARDLLAWAATLLAVALGLPLVTPRVSVGTYAGACLVVSIGGALLAAVRGWRTANALLAQRRRGEWPPA